MNRQQIEQSEGYIKLHQAVISDNKSGWSEEERMKKLDFAVSRAVHYEEKTGIPAVDMLTHWENRRDYWYMSYYQDANQPLIKTSHVRVFETTEELKQAIGKEGFRCPCCKGVSNNPYKCNSGISLTPLNSNAKPRQCNWTAYGLFRDLGEGVFVFVKQQITGEYIFKPVAWETAQAAA